MPHCETPRTRQHNSSYPEQSSHKEIGPMKKHYYNNLCPGDLVVTVENDHIPEELNGRYFLVTEAYDELLILLDGKRTIRSHRGWFEKA